VDFALRLVGFLRVVVLLALARLAVDLLGAFLLAAFLLGLFLATAFFLVRRLATDFFLVVLLLAAGRFLLVDRLVTLRFLEYFFFFLDGDFLRAGFLERLAFFFLVATACPSLNDECPSPEGRSFTMFFKARHAKYFKFLCFLAIDPPGPGRPVPPQCWPPLHAPQGRQPKKILCFQ